MLGPEERRAVDDARRRVRVLLARDELVVQRSFTRLNSAASKRGRATTSPKIANALVDVALEHRERDEARVGVRVRPEARADVVERARELDRAELAGALVEHVRRGVGEARLALRIARSAGRDGEVARDERDLVALEEPHRDAVGPGEDGRRRRDERRRRRRRRAAGRAGSAASGGLRRARRGRRGDGRRRRRRLRRGAGRGSRAAMAQRRSAGRDARASPTESASSLRLFLRNDGQDHDGVGRGAPSSRTRAGPSRVACR